MKTFFWIVLLLVVGTMIIVFSGSKDSELDRYAQPVSTSEDGQSDDMAETKTVVSDGTYVVLADDSTVFWSGKKPLVDGYINTGSMDLKSGSIEIDNDVITGEFTIDMETLSVTDTPTKPGKEDTLEGHLKGAGWFNVEEYPEAKFVITEAVARPDFESTFMYDVKGDLTLKGVTNELSFPAKIFNDQDGLTYASADLEFDRTLWGLTAGSGSFFDNLADNVIDDMVALSFTLVSEQE
ncbi:YceI family protein [Candidatus Nomurabacteria bacterium]|nr:YceI family protein [Candidatus Nomurabacteria bacterium]